MCKLSRLLGSLMLSATLVGTVFAASAEVVRFAPRPVHVQPLQGAHYLGDGWWNDNGVIYHAPHYLLTRDQAERMRLRQDTKLKYGGGPALTDPHVYIVFWGFGHAGDPKLVEPLLKTFIKNIGGSLLENNLTQYYGPGHVFIKNNPNWLHGTWSDDTNPIPNEPTDADVAAEAARLVAHLGGIDPNGTYVVQTAHLHNSAGFGSSFCAYHSAALTLHGVIPYTNEPYTPDAGEKCGANIITPPHDEPGAVEGVTIVAGYELNDSVTDPQPFSGWNASGREIGDLCAWMDIQNDPIGTKSYTSQAEYDNKTGGCTHSGP